MKTSASALFPQFYDASKTPSAVRYIASIDRSLLEDGTYYVVEVGEPGADTRPIVACGGWSRRDKLFQGVGDAAGSPRLLDPETEPARVRAMFVHENWTRRGLGRRILDACDQAARREGFRKLALMATLPGVPLYEAYGFIALERCEILLPDGVSVEGVRMEKAMT